MHSNPIIFLLLCIFLAIGCTKQTETPANLSTSFGVANVDAKALGNDFAKWWLYFNENIILSNDFVALDSARNTISKGLFLEELTSGSYIPLKLEAKDSNTYLMLHPLPTNHDESIEATIQNVARVALKHFKMEQTEFPDFDFKSLADQQFTNENTKGKYLIIKCWFLACGACIKEMPELNELVDTYEHREDVAFVSLAYDPPAALRKFVAKRDFSYEVVSVDRDFMESDLGVTNYPTHFIVDKNGVIKKMVNSVLELKMALKKEISASPHAAG